MVQSCFTGEMRAKQERLRQAPNYTPGDWDWLSIAAFIVDKNLPIPEWTRYVVDEMRVPQPNHLKSPKILGRYLTTESYRLLRSKRVVRDMLETSKARAFTELSMLLEGQSAGDFEQEMTREDLIGMVLANGAASFTPLFRYCWARDQQMNRLAESYYVGAVCQYLTSADVYDEVWGEWVPKDFRAEVRRMYHIRM